MKASPAAYSLIRQFEGLRLAAYRDTGGKLTIGYGHTSGVREGQTITMDVADHMLALDVMDAEREVSKRVTVPITQGQFDACTSFVFNLGPVAFGGSTLLKLINAGKHDEASNQFGRWVHDPHGTVLPGLVKRRAAERALFDSNAGHG